MGNNSLTLKGETQVTKQTPSTKQKTTVQPTPRTYEANPINTTGINSSNKAGTFTRSEGGVFVGRRPPSLLPAPCSSSKTVEVLSLYRLATHTQMTHTHTLSLTHTHVHANTSKHTCMPCSGRKAEASPRLNSPRNHSFKHFVYFVKEFDLIEESEQRT